MAIKKSLFGEGIGVMSSDGSIIPADSCENSSTHGSESIRSVELSFGIANEVEGNISAGLFITSVILGIKLLSILVVLLIKDCPNIVLY